MNRKIPQTPDEKYAAIRTHGFEARLEGKPKTSCPYNEKVIHTEVEPNQWVHSATYPFKAWMEGWNAADAAAQKVTLTPNKEITEP